MPPLSERVARRIAAPWGLCWWVPLLPPPPPPPPSPLLLLTQLLFRAGDRVDDGPVAACCWRRGRASVGVGAIVGVEGDSVPLSLPPLPVLELHPPVTEDARDLRRSIWSGSE